MEIAKVRNIVIVLLLLLVFGLMQNYNLYTFRLEGDLNFYSIPDNIVSYLYNVITLIVSLWAWSIVSKRTENMAVKIIVSYLLSLLIFSIVYTFLYVVIIRYLVYGMKTSIDMMWGNLQFELMTSHFLISAAVITYKYFQHTRDLSIKLERIEREKEVLNSKMLQKNLEPHFLFNNLSLLSGLVKKDPDLAEGFIDDLSDVYRYFLRHSDKELISLQEELEFLRSYTALMDQRFQGIYHVVIVINDAEGHILPCALQLCIENAIKHNQGSKDHPLQISIGRSGEYIKVRNPLRPVDFTLSSGKGNEYLKRQYKIHFNKEVIIEQTEKEYIVSIPII